MKLSIFANIFFFNSLNKLMACDMPVRTGYKLRTIKEFLVKEFDKYEGLRKNLVDKYGDKDEAGKLKTNEAGNVIFSGDNEKLFRDEFGELQECEFTLPQSITLAEIEKIEELLKLKGAATTVLSASDLMILGDLIASQA